MKFTLYYRGLLPSNGRPNEKHRLRQHFHPQLKRLWNQAPLATFSSFYETALGQGEPSMVITNGLFRFVPLVCQELKLTARLDITMLRPGAPGALITSGGDIDNRLKTLLDALKAPSEPNALPKNVTPSTDEDPFFCLLEDDSLITEIGVCTRQWLEPNVPKNEVVAVVDVTTIKTGTFMEGLELP